MPGVISDYNDNAGEWVAGYGRILDFKAKAEKLINSAPQNKRRDSSLLLCLF